MAKAGGHKMFSPARAHKAAMAAAELAKAGDETVHGSEHDVMLAALDQQRRSLSSVQSLSAKRTMKSEFLAEWSGYIDTTLANDSGAHDTIISRLWIWLLDTGEVDTAITLGEYLLRHDLPPAEGFDRTLATIFAEQIAELWSDKIAELTYDQLVEVLELCASHDMPDQVRAKLQRAVGESLAEDSPESAIEHLTLALQLNQNVGCKKLLAALEKPIKAAAKEQAEAKAVADAAAAAEKAAKAKAIADAKAADAKAEKEQENTATN